MGNETIYILYQKSENNSNISNDKYSIYSSVT